MPLPASAPLVFARKMREDIEEKHFRDDCDLQDWLDELTNLRDMAVQYHVWMAQTDAESDACHAVVNLADGITLVLGGLDEDEMSDAPSVVVHSSLPQQIEPAPSNISCRAFQAMRWMPPAEWDSAAFHFDRACQSLDFLRRKAALTRFETAEKRSFGPRLSAASAAMSRCFF
ncbi:unnamed protein product [Symbiodinium sp. CCMP2592]|nr:unnamed protein product [Symbiodinium sp. CCMP2592]